MIYSLPSAESESAILLQNSKRYLIEKENMFGRNDRTLENLKGLIAFDIYIRVNQMIKRIDESQTH